MTTNNGHRDQTIYLNLIQLKSLNNAIKWHYETWVRSAPDIYKEDGFINEQYPVAVTCRYGQNQPLGLFVENEEEEENNWDHDQDFSKLRYISVAIATHLRYTSPSKIKTCRLRYRNSVCQVFEWRSRSLYDVIDDNDEIYDKADDGLHSKLTMEDLDALPLEDEDGHEIPIYTEDGYPIKQQIG